MLAQASVSVRSVRLLDLNTADFSARAVSLSVLVTGDLAFLGTNYMSDVIVVF